MLPPGSLGFARRRPHSPLSVRRYLQLQPPAAPRIRRRRKPKPTRLKLIDGNPGKRPINAREPNPMAGVPTCPAHLSPRAKAEWKRLARQMNALGIVTELDRAALAAYCQAYGRWAEAPS